MKNHEHLLELPLSLLFVFFSFKVTLLESVLL